MNYELNEWEERFIEDSLLREYDMHDIDNWATQEEYDDYSEKLEQLAKKFGVKLR